MDSRILMHQNTAVAEIQTDPECGIIGLTRVYRQDLLPVGTDVGLSSHEIAMELNGWDRKRQIPLGRQNYQTIEKLLGKSVSSALSETLRVSLTDCYWFKNARSNLFWKDVNFHDNGFLNDFAKAELMVDGKKDDGNFVLNIFDESRKMSIDEWSKVSFNAKYTETGKNNLRQHMVNFPDLTTGGRMEKGWFNIDSRPFMVKSGNWGRISEYCEGKHILCANEVAAYKVAKLMGIDCVPYMKAELNGVRLCASPCFIQDADTEFISGWQIMRQNLLDAKGVYKWLSEHGLRKETDLMLLFVHIIHDTDKHLNNFGILRDAKDTSSIRFAPLFDNGLSFASDRETTIKPFGGTRRDQLGMVATIPLDVPSYSEIEEILTSVYEEYEIPEEVLSNVLNDMTYSYRMLEDVKKEKSYVFERIDEEERNL